MSSIFDSVDTAAARRKCKILEHIQTNHIFGQNESNIVKRDTDDILRNSGHILPCNTVQCANKTHTNTKLFSYRRLMELAWSICMICLTIPFYTYIYQITACDSCDIDNINMLPYDCGRFYLGLFVTLPAASVYLFCCSMFFYPICKAAITMSLLSVFIFIFSIENSCMHISYVSDDVIFYMFCCGICFGIVSQYVFFSYLQNSDYVRVLFFTSSALVSLFLLIIIIMHTIFLFIPQSKSYYVLLYTKTIPTAIVFLLHISSTFYTLYPVELAISNLLFH